MGKLISIAFGSGVGFLFGSVMYFMDPRPALIVFLQAPVKWIYDAIDNVRIFPSDSLANLVVEVPFWFGYWICLGGLGGFLLWWVFRRLPTLRSHDDA